MGKIVKYCNSCDEGFASKFAFCPDCGQPLTAFELNPVAEENGHKPEAAVPIEAASADVLEIPNEDLNAVQKESVAEPLIDVAPFAAESAEIETPEMVAASEPVEEPVVEVAAPAVTAAPAKVFYQPTPVDVDRKPVSLEDEHNAYASEGKFYVTVIEEKNVKQRNTLLLGSLCLMIFSLLTGLVYNIFSKDLEVGAISDDIFNAVIVDDIPMTVEEQKQQQKDKDAGGGGGGGRKEEETTISDGANQTQNPERAPQAIPRMTNPDLLLPPAATADR